MTTTGLTNDSPANTIGRIETRHDRDFLAEELNAFIMPADSIPESLYPDVFVSQLARQLLATMQREAELKHDIERYSRIAAELAADEERLPVLTSPWQPIQTVPKDGTPILVMTEIGILAGFFAAGEVDFFPLTQIEASQFFIASRGFTHWMPLTDLTVHHHPDLQP